MEIFKILGTVAIDGMEAATSGLGKLGSVAAKAGAAVAAGMAAGAAAVGALAKQSLDSFSEYEQLVGGAELMFGEAYDFVADKAAKAYGAVQMSQNDYLQQVNGFATGLKTALGGNAQAAAELADKIITAEADIVAATGNSQEAVQNAFNGIMKSNFTMLDNLQLGITPTKEGFQEVIDKVNAWNKANGNATKYQIDNLADCQSALVDYVKMQGLAGYAANEAAGTISGSLAMTKAAWQNMLTGFADDEADMQALIEGLVGSATTAMGQIIPRITEIFSGISSALEQVMPIIVAELPGILEQLLPGLISGATSLITGLVTALPVILRVLIEQLPFVMSQISTGLIQTFPILLQTVKDLFGQIWQYLVNELLGIEVSFEDTFSIVTDIFTMVWDALTMIWDNVGKPLFDIIRVVVETVFKNFKTLWEQTLKPIFSGIIEFLGGVFTGEWERVWQGVESVLKGVLNGIIGAIEWMVNKAIDGLNDLIKGLNDIINKAGALIGFSVSIPLIKNIALPRLEEGGILEKGQVGLLEGNGAEAVVPLDQNKAWISAVARDMESAIGGGATQVLERILEVLQTMDDNMTEKMQDAFASMKFDVNNREFARMVKVV